MFFYTITIAAAIFILMIVVFRLLLHFYFCRIISIRYPGEKIKGCPIWAHAGGKNNKGGRNKDVCDLKAAQQMTAKPMDSNDHKKTPQQVADSAHNFNNMRVAGSR